jgi:hypothetical protein
MVLRNELILSAGDVLEVDVVEDVVVSSLVVESESVSVSVRLVGLWERISVIML